ncbi:hypothetical protein B0H11DRAFT_2294125 [Mycena galericulata]|nr:hypothetical protein B0H11DRAFT_2294125 [Mycena galericulata]
MGAIHGLVRLTNRFLSAHPWQRLPDPMPPSQTRIPSELWELIFEELSGAMRRESSTEYFTGTLSTGALSISSDLLPILQLSRLTPRLHTLVCRFWAFDVLRNLRSLRSFLLRSVEIQTLLISFYKDVVTAHENDTLFPYSQATLLTELGSIFRAMAAKTSTPVVINFPSLKSLRICDNIDPAVVTQFLLRHPEIDTLSYAPHVSCSNEQIATHPLALPRLERLDCEDSSHFGPLLDAFYTSPHLKDSFPSI